MGRCRMPLDIYDMKPEGMTAYLRHNGYHFNKKMCDWAVGNMRKMSAVTGRLEAIEPIGKDELETMLQANGIKLENTIGYDHVYIANMVRADFWGSSISDERMMALYVKGVIDDADQKDGFVFNRFYADCVHGGLPIPWEDVL